MIENNVKCTISTDYRMTQFEALKKKRGHGYTKSLCKKAKSKRRRK